MSAKVFQANLPRLPVEINMELTTSQVQYLECLLPARYKIEIAELKLSRKPTQKSPSVPVAQSIPLPQKRPAREKEPDFLIGQSEGLKKCYKLLQTLKKSPLSHYFFSSESNGESTDSSDEFLDLNTIENKLISKEYLCAYHFLTDLKKMLSASFLVHCKVPEVFLEIFKFSELFNSLFQGCEKLVFSENLIQDLQGKVENLAQNMKEIQSKTVHPKIGIFDKKMTSLEKKQLCQNLKKLDPKHLSGVLKIVKGNINIQGDELEFDVEKLSDKVCRELEKYIKQYLQIRPVKTKNVVQEVKVEKMATAKNENVHSESSESSSSSSQSEEELPNDQMYPELWDREV